METDRLQKLEQVLTHLRPDQKIKAYKLTRFTTPGENYGSLLLRLQIELVNDATKLEERLDLVAKLLPPNEVLRKFYNTQVTFKNEACFYRDVVPLLEEFEKQQGVTVKEIFPKFYGTRFSLDPSCDQIGEGALLLLENLKVSGYQTVERTIGIDLASAKLSIKKLAHFHAISLALKLTNPESFEKNVKPFLTDFHFSDAGIDNFTDKIVNILKENSTCVPYIDRVKELIKQKSLKVFHEPFATIAHNDFWTTNMLFKFDNGEPIAVKFVDLQLIEYKSPCRDLIFFLFSSVQLPVLKQNLDELVDLYYVNFIDKLEELKCDTSPFSRRAFDDQLELAAKESEYFHSLLMVTLIYADSKDVKELDEISEDDFKEENEVSATAKERILYTTLEFVKRGWL